MSYTLKVIQAGNGDAILINFLGIDEKYHNVLIDGGNKTSYSDNLKEELKEIIKREEVLDLVIVTHIDIDHIGGIIKMFDDIRDKNLFYEDDNGTKWFLEINEVWFNANKLLSKKEFLMSTTSNVISEVDGADLELYLENTNFWKKEFIARPKSYKNNAGVIEFSGAKITILAPEKEFLIKYHEEIKAKWKAGLLKHENKNHEISDTERKQAVNNKKTFEELLHELRDEQKKDVKEEKDKSDANLSSIALIFEFGGQSVLLFGDSPHQIITQSLEDLGFTKEKPLIVDYVKLSHHASIKSISYKLLDLVDSKKYIISTNGQRNNLPNKKALAKLILSKGDDVEFYFNHSGESYNIDFYREDVSNKEIDERDVFKFKTFFSRDLRGYNL